MPSITLTPGSSTSNVIRLTYNAGALNGILAYSSGIVVYPNNGSYSYLIQTAGGTYYWATSAGVTEGPEALLPLGTPVTSAEKDTVRYNVLGLVNPEFIQLGYGYLLYDSGLDTYTWCNSGGIEEATPVSATSINTINLTAYRYGELWHYIDIMSGGGGCGGGGSGT
jgi:hypothetical protein